MATRRQREDPPGDESQRQHELVQLVRNKAQRWLRGDNITSVGVGYALDERGRPTKELCIQFTVERKLTPEQLAAEGIESLPESIDDERGRPVKVQVIERRFRPSYLLVEPDVEQSEAEQRVARAREQRDQRRSRVDPLRPGVSVAHARGSAGTLGAIVYDQQDGRPYVLSNWHVLDDNGKIGDPSLQPGPYDGGVDHDRMGVLVRSHLGLAGDCAIASIEARAFDEQILGLDVAPRKVAKAELGDRVVKSGRTTGVTRGVVSRIGLVVKLDYGGAAGAAQIGGFEIRPAPDDPSPPPNGEISMGGDSGSLWLVANERWEPTEVAVGLHFAGETDPRPDAEHAVACNLHSVFDKLGVGFTDPQAAVLSDEQMWNTMLGLLSTFGLRLREIELALRVRSEQTASKPGPCRCGATGEAAGTVALARPEGGLPIYGRWCGPGHGGGEPVDDVDRACMAHDKCYGRNGYFDCGCDAGLLRDLDRAIASGRIDHKARLAAATIRTWFSVQPCVVRIGGIPIPAGTGGVAHAVGAAASFVKSVGKGAQKAWKVVKGWF